ncbi:MAG: hypothetical protein GX213_04025 [Clostridiaceae bacterium]|nr:hypothetical protein [Clostridiaceae bacterium]
MDRPGYFRKYIIFEQLDSGFGIQRSPDGFARLEGYRDGIALSLQIRYLKEGVQPYTVILIYDKDKEIGVFRIGTLQIISRIGSFRKFMDYATIKSLDIKPEKIKYILIASEHKDKVLIPLVGYCKKTTGWDESIRQRLLHKEKKMEAREEKKEKKAKKEKKKAEDIPIAQPEHKDAEEVSENLSDKVDDIKLEKKLKESFEPMEPFSNPRHDYSWYRVNDIAKLSNILFLCNLTIPLFANPKILVGLFKYRHLLCGFYRSDINNLKYFVLGIPAKDETDGKPFENICRWVPVQNSEFGDMTGYWLVYISLRDGEFVS